MFQIQKLEKLWKKNEVSFSLHQRAILKAQELHGMMATGNQESKGYIEYWLHSILQQFLTPYFQRKLVSHTLIFINMHFSNLGMCICEALFRKWFHWKYSYMQSYSFFKSK